MTQIVHVAAIALATLGTGAATMSVMNKDIPDLQVPDGDWKANGALDGRSYKVVGEETESGAVLEDLIVFRDGAFQSLDCQDYCDFGWSDYQTRETDGEIHFTVRMVCPDAPHRVVFYGRIDGDDVTVNATWTTRRWYWTNQIVVRAAGQLVPPTAENPAG